MANKLTVLKSKQNAQKSQESEPVPEKLNINISAYRVLQILRILIRHKSLTFNEMNESLLNDRHISRAFNQETITKYVNTLRLLGCQIPRCSSQSHFRYDLLQSPLPLKLTDDELNTLQRLRQLLSNQPDEELFVAFHEFLEKLIWNTEGLDEEQLSNLFDGSGLLPPDDGVRRQHIEAQRQTLQQFRMLCRDGMMTEVIYQLDPNDRQNDRQSVVTMLVEPQSVLQEKEKLFLLAFDQETGRQIRMYTRQILSFRQLHEKSQHRSRLVTVVFRLTGRLAKSYRLYPNEVILPVYPAVLLNIEGNADDKQQLDNAKAQENQEISRAELFVKHRTDSPTVLLRRLRRYGPLCEILSPMYLRQEMLRQLEEMYEYVQFCF